MIYDIAIIGGGPAGMMAAIQAKTSPDIRVVLLEKNDSLGRKLLLTGKGRCNLTTANDTGTIVKKLGKNGKFMFGPLSRFSTIDTVRFFENLGVELHEERGKRIFPKTGKSAAILTALKKELKEKNVEILYNSKISSIKKTTNDQLFRISLEGKQPIVARCIIIATGGRSYPKTGSTGDGYKFAAQLGHTIVKPHPALVPLIVKDPTIRVSIPLFLDPLLATLPLQPDNSEIGRRFGEMLFTHLGISGPVILDLSKDVGIALREIGNQKEKSIVASIDLKPKVSSEMLRTRLNRIIQETPRIQYKTMLKQLLPKSLIETFIHRTNLPGSKQISIFTRNNQTSIIDQLKNFTFTIDKIDSIERAIVTAGGVKLQEVDPRTMESKIIDGLFFAGEILDLDGPTGGYNLQIAWSTGFVAGINAHSY